MPIILFCDEKPETLGGFKDEGLKRCVSEKFKELPPSKKEFAKIESLNCSGYKIKDLSGLELLKNLKFLDLSSNNIVNINNITKLKKLVSLNLCDNSGDEYVERVENVENSPYKSVVMSRRSMDLSGLKGLDSLKYLALCGSYIKNIEDISKMKKLERLFLHANFITDVRPLNNLRNLKELSLGQNKNVNTNELKIQKNLNKFWYNNYLLFCDRSFSVRRELLMDNEDTFLPFYEQVCKFPNGVVNLPSFEEYLESFKEKALTKETDIVFRVFVWREKNSKITKFLKIVFKKKKKNFELLFQSNFDKKESFFEVPGTGNQSVKKVLNKKEAKDIKTILKSFKNILSVPKTFSRLPLNRRSNMFIVIELFSSGKYRSSYPNFDGLPIETKKLLKDIIMLSVK